MSEWFSRLSGREQGILALAVIVVCGIVLHGSLIEPYQLKQQALQQEKLQRLEDLKWMQTAVTSLKPVGRGSSRQQIQGSLVNALDRFVRQQGLSNSLAQMSPLADGEVRMRFRSVDFNRYLRLLAQFSTAGLVIKDAQITAIEDAPGQVNSNLVLARS